MARVTYESLQKQIKVLQLKAKKLESARDTQKQKAVIRVKSLMKKLGVDLQDLNDHSQKLKSSGSEERDNRKSRSSQTRQKVAPKYRHPETNQTWTGRGKAPKWLALLMAQGVGKEQFLIQKEESSN
jgi:DNA-binding protein H-NS